MQLGKPEQIGLALSAFLLLPTAANAACDRGPEVIVNRGHGASVTFDEPVYQAQLFDVSKLVLEPIPEQGTRVLILTAVDEQAFPGLPRTDTTSLLANTATGCYVFNIKFGDQPVHNTVSASPQTGSEVSRATLLPGGQDIDIEALRTRYAAAVEQHEDNLFLQRVGEFLGLVDAGMGHRLAAQQAGVEWSHLTQLAGQTNLDDFLEDSLGA